MGTVHSWLLSLCAMSTLASCAAEPVEPDTGQTSSDLLGTGDFGADCSAHQKDFLATAYLYGRVAVASRAFEQCVEQAARVGVPEAGGFWTGSYRQCNGDPFYGQPLDSQVQSVLDAARSGNDLFMNCSGGGGLASTSIGPYDRSDAESLSWSVWLNQVIDAPRSGAWPYSQAANSIWHEAMHQHGYTHGGNDQASAQPACGYAGDPTWDYQNNTMPYILGACVSAVLDASAGTCGPIDSCGPGKLKIVTGYGSSACECLADPRDIGTRSANAFTHVTTAVNTSSGMTTLDHPLLNGRADAVVQFTHVYSPAGTTTAAFNGNRPIAFYNYSTGRWVIQNQHGAQMPLGTGFFVRVGHGAVHRTTVANTSWHITRIDHPLANSNPNALVTVSPTPYAGAFSGSVDDHPIGVYYDAGAQRWTIFNQDVAAMPSDSSFTVDVETQLNRGLHFVHLATTANSSAYLTRLSSPLLDGKPNVRFLVTPDWTRGPIYNANDYGVWYDGSSWWIYNESGSGPGATMLLGAAFHIEVLKDEVQRWMRVAESSTGLDTGFDVQPGDRLHVRGSGRIAAWLGAFTVGPEGESAPPYNPWFPMNANRFSLIGRFASDGYFSIGRDLTRNGPSSTQRLTLRSNDDLPGDGSGFFEAEIRAFR